ncbi:chemotaxis protein CheB [Kineococcus glutinatus]|uniref:protein-glutamate methylesterase n=1 Tax=Kineococcus glutinatus TaxID=1070872 RepID=A0ABP8VLC1_9ACTN
MGTRDVVVVGASAGGVEALRTLVAGLPADFPATVLVVLHVPATGSGALAAILDRAGPLPARQAASGEHLPRGTVLVARPDHHLLVLDEQVVVSAGPRENGHRPAVDALFRSAARSLGPRVVGVVLSGMLDDGSAGLVAVRSRGGVGVVQDPADAMYAGMPRNAIEAAAPEHVVPVADIPALLTRLVGEPVLDAPPPSALLEEETAVARFDIEQIDGDDHPGEPAGYSCPDCAGALWRIEESGFLRFRCRVGHAWSTESLLAQQAETMDSALWMALRSLEERAALTRELGRRAESAGRSISAARFAERAAEEHRAAVLIRELLTDRSARTGNGERVGDGEPVGDAWSGS